MDDKTPQGQKDLTNMNAAMAQQYLPQAMGGISGMLQGNPQWLQALATNQTAAVNQGTNSTIDQALQRLSQRGMLSSGVTGNTMAQIAAGNTQQLAGIQTQNAQMGDQRQQQLLQMLLNGAQGNQQTALGGYGAQMAQQQQQAGQLDNILMGLGGGIGGLLGSWRGGMNPMAKS